MIFGRQPRKQLFFKSFLFENSNLLGSLFYDYVDVSPRIRSSLCVIKGIFCKKYS